MFLHILNNEYFVEITMHTISVSNGKPENKSKIKPQEYEKSKEIDVLR